MPYSRLRIYFLHHELATSLGLTLSTPVSSPQIYIIHHELATSSGFTRSTYSAGPKRALQTADLHLQVEMLPQEVFPHATPSENVSAEQPTDFSSYLSSSLIERYSSTHILHSLSSSARSITSTDVKGWRTFTAYASCKISSSRRPISACSMQQCNCTRRPRGPSSSFSRVGLRMTVSAIFSSALRQPRSAWVILPWNGSSAPPGIVIEN